MARTLLLAALLLCPGALAEIRVEDYLGREVRLAAPAQRIVALAPHIVENLFAAGAGHRVVGAVDYSDYPERARLIRRVGSFNAFSLETIIAVQPDLVVMWGSGNGMATLAKLETLGVPVFVSEPRRLADIPRSLRLLAAMAGTSAEGDAAARLFAREVAQLRAAHTDVTTLEVLLQLWHQPLQTVNGEHLISEVIALCGGHNLFADAATLAPRINLESVLLRDPDAIVASGAGPRRPAWLDEWRAFPSLRAVQDEALFYIDPDHLLRPTPRLLLGARTLCRQLDGLRRQR